MAQFFTVLTQTGQAKMANAIALGTMIEITQLAVGDGGGSLPQPDSTRETLINEVRRAPINRVEVDADNPNWLVVEQILPPDVGGWTIREVGIIDADGDLIGYGNYPETYKPTLDEGSGRTQTIRMVLEVSHTSAVTLRVDPSVVLATREYVGAEIDKHEKSRNHPVASETSQGMLKTASEAEALEGIEGAKAMTPVRTHQAFNKYGLGAGEFKGTTDLDSLNAQGFYYINGDTPGLPISANGSLTVGGQKLRPTQTFTASEENRTFVRSKYDDGGSYIWKPWQELISSESEQQLGYNQTWRNVTGSRSKGVTYTNTYGKPIAVSVMAYAKASGNIIEILVDGEIVNSTSVYYMPDAQEYTDDQRYLGAFAIVPPGATYKADADGTDTIFRYMELR